MKNVMKMFENQVKNNPDKTAIIFKDKSLTYGELDQYSSKMAAKLIENWKIERNDIIPIFLNRSEKVIISILAILKAGAAYTIISKSYPQDRVNEIINELNPKLVISENNFERINNLEYRNLYKIHSDEDDLFYLIYTSGTTGRPKGVLHTVKSVAAHIETFSDFVNVSQEVNNMLCIVNFSFSVAVTQIFSALAYGKTLYISDEHALEDINSFEKYIHDNNIEYFVGTPTLANSLNFDRLPKLKVISVVGEKVTPELLYKSQKNNIKLINVYGQSEFHGGTGKVITGINDINNIGKAFKGLKVKVLDDSQNEVGIGEVGEFCASGIQVSKGYYKNRVQTEKHFKKINGETWCFTGDLVRRLNECEFEYVGRKDFQLNINGIRIEPADIEKNIEKVKGVESAIVIMNSNNNLIAYYTGEHIKKDFLQKELEKYLPHYMIPQLYMHLNKFPMTPNGKVDRRGLPNVKREMMDGKPQTLSEKLVVSIAKKILGVKNLSLQDSFTELGGDSLKAIKFVNELRDKTNVKMKVSDLYGTTLKEISKKILGHANNSKMTKVKKGTVLMSSVQKRMYMFYKLNSADTLYNEQTVLNFNEKIDVKKFRNAIDRVCSKHESLRTKFMVNENGEYVQSVMEKANYDFKEIYEKGSNKTYKKLIKPLNIEKGQTMRVIILHQKNKDSVFVDKHHIITDGYSENIFYKELSDAYKGKKLNENVLHYKDYSEWLRNLDVKKEKEWWNNYLKGYTRLPLVFDKGSNKKIDGKLLRAKIDSSLRERVKLFSIGNNVSEYDVFFAIFSIILSKFYNSEDFVIGTVESGRIDKNVENMLGMFVNTLPVRVNMDYKLSLKRFIINVRNNILKVIDNENYQFENIAEDFNENGMNENPFFDCMFVYHNESENRCYFNNAKKSNFKSSNAKFPLTFELENDGRIFVTYDSNKFNENTVQRLVDKFLFLLNKIDDVSDIPLKELSLLTKSEKKSLLYFPELPKHLNVVDRFEQEVNRHPDHIALVDDDNTYSYKELNNRVNQVSHYLKKYKHVKKGMIVPLLLNRSCNIVIAILAVLKTGAAYVPISLKYPKQRIDDIVGECNSNFILDDKEIDSVKNDETETDNLNIKINMSDPAYLIFTSGTTGKPKGVIVNHKNLSNYVTEIFNMKNSGMHPGMVNGAFFEYVFDSSVHDLIRPLMMDETIVILETSLISDIEALTDKLNKYKVNAIGITPSVASKIDLTKVKSLEQIYCGGEKISYEVINKYKNTGIQLNNCYGPTETTVLCMVNNNAKDLSIGKPLNGVHPYVLDNYMNLLPQGAVGTLFIGGNQVTDGYINSPQQTKKSYIKNMFEDEIYNTGDLVRIREDGRYEYFGRKDNQVKIRGYRIELDEVKKSMKSLEDIEDCAILVKEDNLVAYYTGRTISKKKIYEKLAQQLPKYMIPSIFIHIPYIPLTINGKLDKNKLLKINIIADNSKIKTPKTAEEKKINNAFTKVLGLDTISIDDDFFKLGGNSIKAISVANVLKIRVKDLYKYRTVESLAQNMIPNSEKLVINDNSNEYTELSFNQREFLYLNQSDKQDAYNIPIVLDFKNDIKIKKFKNALEELIRKNQILCTYYPGGKAKISNDISIYENSSVDVKAFYDYRFDLTKELPIRVKINKNSVWINIHHIAFDGWSVKIFLTELDNLYKGHKIKDNAVSYAQFSNYQNNGINTDNFRDSKKYWINNLRDYSEFHLPYDFIDKNSNSTESEINYNLSNSILESLSFKTRQSGITRFSYTLAAFVLTLSTYAMEKDVVVGVPFANRKHHEFQNVIGSFVNTLPLRFKIDGQKTLQRFVENVDHIITDSRENEEYPFSKIVTDLKVSTLNVNPLFNVIFNEDEPISSYESFIVKNDVVSQKSKVDLTVTLHQKNLYLNYNSKLFKKKTIYNFAKNYEKILNYVLNSSSKKIRDIKLTDNCVYSKDNLNVVNETLVSLVNKQMIKHPNKIAVACKKRKLSYEELDLKSNIIANDLISKGIKKGDIVPIMLPRDENYVIAILGVLKSGAAYVPLDVNYPIERTNYIKRKVKCSICIDEGYSIDTVQRNEVNNIAGKDDLAYLIFTSGTTGNPKGVKITHENILNTIQGITKMYGINKTDSVLQYANFIFDASVFEIFVSLINGSTLYIADEETRKDYNLLKKYIENNKIAVALLPPVILNSHDVIKVDKLFVGGEETPYEVYLNYYRHGVKIINLYGPTESSVCVTTKVFTPNIRANNIGKCIPNMYYSVRNEYGVSVPQGCIGELWIGGIGISQGYLDANNGHNSFISGMYNTGDLVVEDLNGDLLFLGRKDNQVKLSGYRIELKEIESKLLKQTQISNCCVTVKNGKIYAYYVGNLSSKLNDELPNYMIPSRYIKVSSIPVTLNGKVDYDRLNLSSKNDSNVSLPENKVEEKVKKVIESLTGITDVSMESSFYEIGGNSLDALKVSAELNLPVKEIINSSSLRNIAKRYQKKNFEDKNREGKKIRIAPLTDGQKEIWVSDQLSSKGIYNIPLIFHVRKSVDNEKLEKAIQNIVRRHDILRCNFSETTQTVKEGGLSITHDPIDIDEYSKRKFDLKNEIPIRVNLHEGILAIVFHHIAFDGWSTKIFLGELETFYKNETPEKLQIQFLNYAQQQHEEKVMSQLEFWRNYLEGYKELIIPLDKLRPVRFSYNGRTVIEKISRKDINTLKKISQRLNVSLYSLLLSIWEIVLSSFSNQNDFIIGSPFANRMTKSQQKIIGFFVNTLPIRLHINEDSEFEDVVKENHEMIQDIQKNQNVSLGKILKEIGYKKSASKNPLFQVLFSVQNFIDSKDDQDIFERKQLDVMNGITKYDLSLVVKDNTLILQYNEDLFKSSTVNALLNNYIGLIGDVIENENRNVKKQNK